MGRSRQRSASCAAARRKCELALARSQQADLAINERRKEELTGQRKMERLGRADRGGEDGGEGRMSVQAVETSKTKVGKGGG